MPEGIDVMIFEGTGPPKQLSQVASEDVTVVRAALGAQEDIWDWADLAAVSVLANFAAPNTSRPHRAGWVNWLINIALPGNTVYRTFWHDLHKVSAESLREAHEGIFKS